MKKDMEIILEVENLSVQFPVMDEVIHAVRGVSFSIPKGKTLGLVGESGCGKSVTAFSVLKLVPHPGVITGGRIQFKNSDLLQIPDNQMLKIRGKEIAMIFQEPMTSLNPVFTIGYQIIENINAHMKMSHNDSKSYAVEMLRKVGIPDAVNRLDAYPHEFSGGMRQRAMMAMALSANPSMLIADEPTTALDVTIQAQILDLIVNIQKEKNMAMLLITHDLGIVANIADDIAIMYAGEIVEYGTTVEIFKKPLHPYTRGLFDAIPKIGKSGKKLSTIPGVVPSLAAEPAGCVFHPRCTIGTAECLEAPVALESVGKTHRVRCIKCSR